MKSPRKTGSSGGGIFSRKVFGKLSGKPGGPKSHESEKPSKPVPGGFKKPHNEPGTKIRPETDEVFEESGTYAESGSGGGCCSSISGIITLIVVGVIVVVVVFILKCF